MCVCGVCTREERVASFPAGAGWMDGWMDGKAKEVFSGECNTQTGALDDGKRAELGSN